MSSVSQFPDMDLAREEAATWIARAFRGLSPEEDMALRLWSQRPANRRAMAEMSDVWEGLDVLAVLSEIFPRDEVVPQQASAPRPAEPSPWRARGLAIAASVAVATCGALLYVSLGTRGGERDTQVASTLAPVQALAYSSTVGEQRSIPLADGSTLALNSGSVVEVTFSPGLRSVTLHRGEALFQVAHDVARPFVVTVNGRTVRAVGTAFNVRRRGDTALDVLVTEGVVSTHPGAGPPSAQPDAHDRLESGQLLRVAPDGSRQIRKLSEAERDAIVAWRRGVLVLDGITLATALDEVARYTTRRIQIDDPAIAARRLGGSLPVADLEALLKSLDANFGVEAKEDSAGVLHLSAKESAGASNSRQRDRGG